MTFLSRRKHPITRRAPIRCAWTAISLAAGWLASAGVLPAQSTLPGQVKHAPIDIEWPSKQAQPAPPPPPIRNEAVPPLIRQPGDGRIKTVTYSRPPVSQINAAAGGMMNSQLPGGRPYGAMESDADYFRTDLPGADRLFERKSEAQFYDTIRAEAQARGAAIRPIFPERIQVSKEKFKPRAFKEMATQIEPSFVMHRRLLFEQPNSERQGWELGNLQSGISTLRFVYDVVALPYHTWTRPLEKWDSSAGKCLPGDATPLFLYREEFSVTGLVAQAGAVAGGFLLFP